MSLNEHSYVTEYFPRLKGYLIKRGIESTDSEDLANLILAKVWQNRAQLKDADAFESWIFTIARNESMKWGRHKQAAKRAAEVVPLEERNEGMDGPDSNPEQLLIAKDLEAAAKACAAKLPDKLKQVFVMTVFQELPHDRVAAILNLKPGTLKSRLSNGRKQVAQCLKRLMGRSL